MALKSISKFDYAKLYDMSDALKRGALRVSPKEDINKAKYVGGKQRSHSPLRMYHFMGGKQRDLIGSGYAGLYCFSDRVIEILTREGFSGWTTFPVEIFNKAGRRVEGYHGFSVTGRCGPIDWSLGKKVLRPPLYPGGPPFDVWVGMYFDPNTWDGSDIFLPKRSLYCIVREPVMRALTRAKVTNFMFVRLTEFERAWDEDCDD